MKTSLLIAALFLVTVSASAQSFRGVSWGMSRADVAATGDDPDSFRATAFGLPAVIRYRYTAGRLTGIDVDYSRSGSADVDLARATLTDAFTVNGAMSAAIGGPGHLTMNDRGECGDDPLIAFASGCRSIVNAWYGPETTWLQSIDGAFGRLSHVVTLRPVAPSAVDGDRALPSIMSLD